MSVELSITTFLISTTMFFLAWPLIYKPFEENSFLEGVFKRGSWIISVNLAAFTTTIITNLAKTELTAPGVIPSGLLNVPYLIFNIGGYVLTTYFIIRIIIQGLMSWKNKKLRDRFG